MKTKDFLKKVAYIGKFKFDENNTNDVYYSKFDNSYITHVGMEDKIEYLANLEITEELTHGVGFSPKDGKWYGWSHRAIYGFEIGSKCSKGDCHYVASTPEDLINSHAEFFGDISEDSANRARAECQILDDKSGIRILTTPIKMQVAKSMDELDEAIAGNVSLDEELVFKEDFHVVKCGRGEWLAKTLDDAKLMAIDFNEGVS